MGRIATAEPLGRCKMKRGYNSEIHSFEMFLDIICNAFGGIIFIALLLCIMLQVSGGALSVSQENEHKKQQETVAEIARLKELLEIQNQQLDAMRKNTDDEKLREYLQLKKEIEAKLAELKTLRETKLLAAQNTNDIESELSQLEKTNAELLENIRSLTMKNLLKTASSGIVLSVPQEQVTRKTPVNVLLRGGRIAFLNVYDAAGEPAGRNTSQVSITTKGGQISAMPLDGAGMELPALSDSDTPAERKEKIANAKAAITPMLKKFPQAAGIGRSGFYLNIAVWEDSFARFESLRDALLEMNYDYNLIPVENGQSVPLMKTGEKTIQ